MTEINQNLGNLAIAPVDSSFFAMLSSPRLIRYLTKNAQGFTLLELMIVVIIIGLLAAIAIPVMIGNVHKARYANAKMQMGCMMRELKAYRFENGTYPGDQSRNTPYPDAECFVVHEGYVKDNPTVNQTHDTDVPFNSVYDYESWDHGTGCYIAITFFGRNGLRKFEQGNKNALLTLGFHTYDATDDDLVLVIDITDSPCAP